MPRLVLETARLQLLELEDGDAAFVVELLNTDGFLRHIGDRGVRTPADALRYIHEGPRASYAAHGFGLWKVLRKTDGVAVGMCGLLQREWLPRPDIGYAFLPRFEGQGLASEAGKAVIDYGFRRFNMPQVLAVVSPGNAGSARVLGKIGMRALGPREFNGETLDVFAIEAPSRV